MNRKRVSRSQRVARGLASGVVGGLAAAFVMNRFQAGLAKLAELQGSESQQPEGDDATVKTASAVSESVFDHTLTEEEKEEAGPAVHYAFGATMGAFYGVLSELEPRVSAGFGLPFGAGLWLVADEVGVPALGLSKVPTEYPASTHASALAAHLVYGLSVDLVRRVVTAAAGGRR